MIIDKYRNATCPNCGQDHLFNILFTGYSICPCGKPLRVTTDEIDGTLRYLLEVVPDEELHKLKLSPRKMSYL